ncbi:FAR1 DNA binding domain - like 10 [Theobroma cacao]|nr:FAR1 DNA binding domain - like 10 [Theobroma cacao]
MESEENNLSDAKYLHELSKDDILSLEFDNLEDVYEFYKAYAYAIGFGVRKDSCRRNKDGIEVMKHFACLKEGHRVEKWKKLENRMREPKSSSRTDCKANIRVILNKDTGKWYVSHCELKHNHHMVNLAQIGFIRSNRHIKVADVCEAKVMKVAAQARGIQNVGFMHKDFYNRMVAEEHAEENDGEVQATLIITSTSRYEGLNSFIAFVAKERKTLLEFVRAIEDEIKNIRNNEIGEDYISIHTELVSSQIFKDIEKHVASVYTRRTFKKFIDEMCLQQLFYHECRIDDVPSIQVYHLMKYGDLSERIRVEFHVDDYKMLMS